jgi:Flp pilus assembly protein TadD
MTSRAIGRNEPCPCGSGKKYKLCHGALDAGGPAARAEPAGAADPEAVVRDALAAHQRNDLDRAEHGYRAALAASPAHPLATHYLGVILYQRNRLDEALPLLERAAADVPQEPEFHNNLGLALAAAERNDEAIAAYRRALALKPEHAVAWNNLGLVLQASNRLPEAIAAFREALAHAPDFAQAHWNLALALLVHGEFGEGWREFEWRLSVAELGGRSRAHDTPRWDGVIRAGLVLLVTPEQGLGDALQFIRFATPLARRGVRVVAAVRESLARLVATVHGVAEVVGPDAPLPAHDAHIELLSLPHALAITPADIPADVPYLRADPARRARAAEALARHAGRLKVGLAWAGSRAYANDRRRSMALAALAPLFALRDVTWFSLQKGDGADETARVPAAAALVPLPADDTLDSSAALIAELDLVVSVDTSLAHLAGALGKPVWILLPFAPDWRWQLERTDSPWYPTARLFRQPRPGDWGAVVGEVARALVGLRDRR